MTLPEMLIVLAIVGIMGGVALPHFLRETPAAKAARGAETLANDMSLARFRAISLNRDVYFHLEPGGVSDAYHAYANLGDPDDVPTGTQQEIAAVQIEFPDDLGGTAGRRLPDGVHFAVGGASGAPGGGAVGGALDVPTNPFVLESRGTVRWEEGEEMWAGVVYVTHEDDPEAVRAVTVSRTGLIRVWYRIGGSWQ